MAARTERFIEPDERIEHVVMARTGPSPWWTGIVGIGFLLGLTKYRLLVVTDRNVIVLRAGGLNGTVPKEMIRRLRRPTNFGPTSGLWAKVHVANEDLWVHKRFQAGLAIADRATETG
ncbi:MAG: hypothetical protein NVS3B12_18050 [Acidimicrobiales bacterium]